MEKLNPELNAVIHELYDRARTRPRAQLPDGPFRGVPFLLKDLMAELAGTPFSEGMAFAGDYRSTGDPDADASATSTRASSICGKTNAPELGILPTTEPRRFGPSRNPWDTAHSTGGSSGGSAAAVASGMVPAAHANDGGGSDPDPGVVLRACRPQADAWAQLAGARSTATSMGGLVCRARGDTLGARLGRHPRRHGRTRPRRPLLGAPALAGPRSGRGRDATAAAAHRRAHRDRPPACDVHPDCVAAAQAAASAVRVTRPPHGGGARSTSTATRSSAISSTCGRPATHGPSRTGRRALGRRRHRGRIRAAQLGTRRARAVRSTAAST